MPVDTFFNRGTFMSWWDEHDSENHISGKKRIYIRYVSLEEYNEVYGQEWGEERDTT